MRKKRWATFRVDYTGSPVDWVCPAGVFAIFVRGCGGGGSGAKGSIVGFPGSPGGAGGGGGAIESEFTLAVTPGQTYTFFAGPGGATKTTTGPGNNGTDSVLTLPSAEQIAFVGARGGREGQSNASAQGGDPFRQSTHFDNGFNPQPGLGGWGTYSGSGFTRGQSGYSSNGGDIAASPGGLTGTDDGAQKGGGGGGGGGYGGCNPSTGGAGGDGGNGNSAGVGTAGTAGTAGAFPGGGGGGGGGGGSGSGGSGAGGNGGAGAHGYIEASWLE